MSHQYVYHDDEHFIGILLSDHRKMLLTHPVYIKQYLIDVFAKLDQDRDFFFNRNVTVS